DTKGKRKVIVTPEVGEAREYLIPKGKHISAHEGDHVRAGEPLMDGSSNPHDILTILGEKALAKYLVDEVQELYRLKGVRSNDTLAGVKENVIMGRLIPAGTGLKQYNRVEIETDEPEERPEDALEAPTDKGEAEIASA